MQWSCRGTGHLAGRCGLESQGGKPQFEKSAQHGPSGCYQHPPEHPAHAGAHGQAGAPRCGTQLHSACTRARTGAAQLEQAPSSLHCRSHPADLLWSLQEYAQRHFCDVPFEKQCFSPKSSCHIPPLAMSLGKPHASQLPPSVLVPQSTWCSCSIQVPLSQREVGSIRISPIFCTGGV